VPVSFERIPSSIRVPLFYVEVSARQASYFSQNQVSLLFGPMLPSGLAQPLAPVVVSQFDTAVGLFGAGSILADMVNVFRKNDSMGELWCIPHAEDTAWVAAQTTMTITVAGPVGAGAGTLFVYVAGLRIPVYVANGDDQVMIATKVSDAINAEPFCLVRATLMAAGMVQIDARNRGVLGNFIDVSINYRGIPGGEFMPANVTIAMPTLQGGVGEAPMDDIITAMADDEYDFICSPYNDAVSLDKLDELMNDVTGRWSWDRQIYGGVFSARMASATLAGSPPTNYPSNIEFGRTRNGPHVYILAHAENNPSPHWQRAAALTGQAAVALRIDPARPLQTLPLVGVYPPQRGKDYRLSDKNSLLYAGMGIEMTDFGGQVRIQRCVSTYQKNAWNQPDPSWLDVQTAYTLMYIIRFLRQRLLQKFPRHKLANDGTPFGAGQAVATPSIIRGELVAAYSELQYLGMVENIDAFKAHLIVERNATDPNRVDILFPPDLVNQLRVLALLVEFRLQYPTIPPGGIPVAEQAA
jgi:phage tail sheath gpL-like